MDAATVAAIGSIIAALGVVLGPVVVSSFAGRARRLEKAQDWERQDEVADRAAKTAEMALEASEALRVGQEAAAKKAVEAASLLIASNEKVATIAAEGATVNREIHRLVNSDMTARMQSELDARIGELVAIRELSELKHSLTKIEPSEDMQKLIASKEAKIAGLKIALDERRRLADAPVINQE